MIESYDFGRIDSCEFRKRITGKRFFSKARQVTARNEEGSEKVKESKHLLGLFLFC